VSAADPDAGKRRAAKGALILTRGFLLAIVLAMHVEVQFLLYGERVHLFLKVSPSGWFQSDLFYWEGAYRLLDKLPSGLFGSDLFVFLLPALIAFLLCVAALRAKLFARAGSRWLVSLGGAFGLVLLSNWAGMFVSLNTYGE
jgi:hypothetical protein